MTRARARELVASLSGQLRALSGVPGALVVTDGPAPSVRVQRAPWPSSWPLAVRRALEVPPAGPWRWLVAEGGPDDTAALAVPVTWPSTLPHARGAA